MTVQAEFSRPILASRISTAGVAYDIEAGPDERAALARRFGLLEITDLKAHVRLKAVAGGTLYRVDGRFQADVVQSCVVTLAPVPARVEEEFHMTFSAAAGEEEEAELDLTFEGDDPPDPLVDGTVDIGEAVAEHLSLALDPFPRAPGATFEAPAVEDAPVEEKPNPFAALARLRKKEE